MHPVAITGYAMSTNAKTPRLLRGGHGGGGAQRRRGPVSQPLEAAGQPGALLAPRTVGALLGVSTDTVRRMVAQGEFPTPIVLSANTHRWLSAVVHAWIAERSAGAAAAPAAAR